MQKFWQRRQTLPWWKHRYIQDHNGCEVLAFNDPALHLTLVLKQKNLFCVCSSSWGACLVMWDPSLVLYSDTPGDQLLHSHQALQISRSVFCGCNTPHMDTVSVQLQKEVFLLNRDRALMPFRWPLWKPARCHGTPLPAEPWAPFYQACWQGSWRALATRQ